MAANGRKHGVGRGNCPVEYICTFRHPDTGHVVAELIMARNANEAMDALWDRYNNRVGSVMARPRDVKMFAKIR